MAGNAGNWFKRGGNAKRRVFIPNAIIASYAPGVDIKMAKAALVAKPAGVRAILKSEGTLPDPSGAAITAEKGAKLADAKPAIFGLAAKTINTVLGPLERGDTFSPEELVALAGMRGTKITKKEIIGDLRRLVDEKVLGRLDTGEYDILDVAAFNRAGKLPG